MILTSPHSPRIRPLQQRCRGTRRGGTRRAFTLIELLVTIVIMLILASMVLFALAGAQTSAKDAKTRATISKLHNFLMEKHESFLTRRVPIVVNSGTGQKGSANLRLNALRDIMRMEMPDRHSDYWPANPPVAAGLTAVPSVTNAYRRRVNTAPVNSSTKPNAHAEFTTYESAECLYMIIAFGLEDQEALAAFSESEIADVDGDGLREFIDGWGKPIAFLRWAPKFPSEIQFPRGPETPPDPTLHHDPFDILNNDQQAYALYPLIYSAGPDQIFDIQSKVARNPIHSPFGNTNGLPQDLQSEFGNADGVENWHDNITNHELLGP